MAGNHSQISQQYSTFLQENKNLLTTVTLDPWAKISNENSEYWGVIHECEKPVLSERCYVHYTSSSLDRYIIYEDYHECAHHEWLLLPGFPLLDQKLLIVIYMGFLIYLFLGVAIISDVFMASIEVITSKVKVVKSKDPKTGEESEVEVLVWNATVANLTLMALGSSAPEILLAVIETLIGLLKDEEAGELGASTIVGSAAFNLLFISAVCMVAVPEGERRMVEEVPVFLVTAVFSIFAYIWLLVVLVYWTPNTVTPGEAVLTALFFPVLVTLSYMADIGMLGKFSSGDAGAGDVEAQSGAEDGDGHTHYQHVTAVHAGDLHADRQQIANMMRELKHDNAGRTTKMNAAVDWMSKHMPVPMNRMQFRMNAVRGMFGRKHMVKNSAEEPGKQGNKVSPARDEPQPEPAAPNHATLTTKQTLQKRLASSSVPVFAFAASAYSVLEKHKKIAVTVMRGGPMATQVSVFYETEDGTATAADNDYTPCKGTLVFEPMQEKATVEIAIMDDDFYEPDEEFYLKLSNPSHNGEVLTPSVEITIIDDDEPGILVFDPLVVEALETASQASVCVKRQKGCDGRVTVDYRTLDMTAVKGEHYLETSGTLVFESNDAMQVITVRFPPGHELEVQKSFAIQLDNPTGGVQVSKRNKCVVTFVPDDEVNEMTEKIVEKMKNRMDVFKVGGGSWSQQFKDAMYPGGGVDEEGNDIEPEAGALLMHYLCITWKVLFAVVPPTDYYGGWATFCCSLGMIGVVTLFVGEVAALLGCAMGIKDSITAITFVALGTSLPDTFASKQATIESPNADAAIGNVTGSNSVNVFLGLGLPWLMAVIWKGGDYSYPAGDLKFSVQVFTVCALMCLFTLFVRRKLDGAELGGNRLGAKVTAVFFVTLWFAYIIMSAMQAEGNL
mmetsp:Transcript_32344/g.62174  ORF Transcript_32344/g.62174 Transcript_32344/m.62174 type:complete len:898 (-) Transcript_32344:491-3184(-)